MKTSIGLLALAFTLVGCGDKQSTAEAPAPTKSAADGTYLGNMVQAQKLAVKTVDTVSLNSAIQTFQVQEGRNPKDLNELIEMKIMGQLPLPPKGMKFDYDAKAGTVKVVPQ